jgi:lysophospholipase L1-like esterase
VTASRKRPVALIAAFLILIGIVAPSQIIWELRDGESPQVVDLFRQVPTPVNLGQFESRLESNCRLAQVVRPWVQYARFAVLEDAGDKALVGRDGWFFYRPAVQYLIEPYSPPEDLFTAIVSFRDDLARRGIKLLVMPAPNKASIYPEMLAAGASQPVNTKTRDVLARLTESGIEIVDLFELYDKARETGGGPDYYLAQDSHWSPEGMRLAADVVAHKLLESGRVQRGMVKYESKPVTVERYGDVLRMIRVSQVEKLYEPQRMNCAQVIDAATGQPYKDDPNSPVLVLGDSFLRIFERDEPGSAGFVAHLARNLGSGVTSVINDGGASTLVRQQLASRPALLAGKKVVIWEFVERDIRFGTEGWQVIRVP